MTDTEDNIELGAAVQEADPFAGAKRRKSSKTAEASGDMVDLITPQKGTSYFEDDGFEKTQEITTW